MDFDLPSFPETAADFHRRAEHFKALAHDTRDDVMREELLRLVQVCLELAERIEGSKA
jgi:hypothetical protein